MIGLYTAAHGGYSREAVPLGGGATISDRLVAEWERTRPFELRLISPAILGSNAPSGRDLVKFGERDYARFCREFERACTAEVLRHQPAETVVLVNDVSEGPDFEWLAKVGYRVFTIYHVDVVAYVAAIYLRGWVRPETTVRGYSLVRSLLPDIMGLIWAKQFASVRFSRGLIMPSAGMRDLMLRCYPDCPTSKFHVLPWGTSADSFATADAQPLSAEFGIPKNAKVLLTLSRISPEKGQHLLLEALLEWEHRKNYPAYPLWLFICGDAAFMQGERYLARLRSLAARLKRTRVVFPGYVTGERKRQFFALADLFVFPSRHESYGLTLIEALAAGLPAVCLDNDGARSVMREEFGAIVRAAELRNAIARLLENDAARKKMAKAARRFAEGERFEDRAAELARLLVS